MMVTLSAAGLVATGADDFLIVVPAGFVFDALGKTVAATGFGATT